MFTYSIQFTALVPLIIWFDSLNYILMSTVYLVDTIYFTISNGKFLDNSSDNPVNYFFYLWVSMPIQYLLAIFAEPFLIPIFMVGIT